MTYYGWLTEGSAFAKKPLLGKRSRDYVLEALKGVEILEKPEQLSGKKIDGRSDLFSLSVMLYQLLGGRLPFVGESMAQLMFKIANEPCADIRTVNPQVPAALAAVVAKAMSKNVLQRYQTGDEMATDLRNSLAVAAPLRHAAPDVDIQL